MCGVVQMCGRVAGFNLANPCRGLWQLLVRSHALLFLDSLRCRRR